MALDNILKQSACPDEAEENVARFLKEAAPVVGQSISFSPINENFVRIFGNSRFLSRFVIRHPQTFTQFSNSPYKDSEKSLAVFENEIQSATKSCTTLSDFVRALKFYKYNEYVRLTIRELCQLEQREIYREFSHLAIASGKSLVKKIAAELSERYDVNLFDTGLFAIISMGKLGGLELNYSSDIDLIGLYEDEKKHLNISNHEFFTKLFTRLGQVMSERDEMGFLYRVDWDLRPEGKSGTLANSLPAMETYYQTFGEDWERQAFIKAGVFFETGKIGQEFVRLMQPFVYKKYVDSRTIERIWDIKSRIISEHTQKKPDGINIKLGQGGIRDVEFLVQGFQLLFGGKDPELRESHTLTAIDRLRDKGILPADESSILKAGYLFLRRVESALQMEEEQQTQTMPGQTPEIVKVARRCGFQGEAGPVADHFMEQLQKSRGLIHNLFKKYYEQ